MASNKSKENVMICSETIIQKTAQKSQIAPSEAAKKPQKASPGQLSEEALNKLNTDNIPPNTHDLWKKMCNVFPSEWEKKEQGNHTVLAHKGTVYTIEMFNEVISKSEGKSEKYGALIQKMQTDLDTIKTGLEKELVSKLDGLDELVTGTTTVANHINIIKNGKKLDGIINIANLLVSIGVFYYLGLTKEEGEIPTFHLTIEEDNKARVYVQPSNCKKEPPNDSVPLNIQSWIDTKTVIEELHDQMRKQPNILRQFVNSIRRHESGTPAIKIYNGFVAMKFTVLLNSLANIIDLAVKAIPSSDCKSDFSLKELTDIAKTVAICLKFISVALFFLATTNEIAGYQKTSEEDTSEADTSEANRETKILRRGCFTLHDVYRCGQAVITPIELLSVIGECISQFSPNLLLDDECENTPLGTRLNVYNIYAAFISIIYSVVLLCSSKEEFINTRSELAQAVANVEGRLKELLSELRPTTEDEKEVE